MQSILKFWLAGQKLLWKMLCYMVVESINHKKKESVLYFLFKLWRNNGSNITFRLAYKTEILLKYILYITLNEQLQKSILLGLQIHKMKLQNIQEASSQIITKLFFFPLGKRIHKEQIRKK